MIYYCIALTLREFDQHMQEIARKSTEQVNRRGSNHWFIGEDEYRFISRPEYLYGARTGNTILLFPGSRQRANWPSFASVIDQRRHFSNMHVKNL